VGEQGLPIANEPLVRQYARSLLAKSGTGSEAHILALRAQPSWSGPAELEIATTTGESRRVLIRACVSPLAVRDACVERQPDELLIVLTDSSDADLGLGILSRCFDQRVVAPSMWEAVKEAFSARQIDSVLARMTWVAEPLVSLAPAGGWPVASTGLLTRDHAISHLTGAILGMPPSELDPSGVLAWTLDRPAVGRFREQSPAVQQGIFEWVSSAVGPVAGIAVRSSMQPHSVDALTLGLAADVLWASEGVVTPELVAARTRLEPWTGVRDIDDNTARSFAESARGSVQRMAQQRDPAYPGILARATELFADLGFQQGAAMSLVLPSGFEARMRTLAERVQEFVLSDGQGLPEVEHSFTDLVRHEQAEANPRLTVVPRMAVRLARWLTRPPGKSPTNLREAMLRQVRDNAFVDWAAADIWVGSTDQLVAPAWSALYASVRARREVHDREYAVLLADATTRGVLPDGLVPIEHLLSQTCLPLASGGNRLLVVLIDGMSAAVAAELTEEALNSGWFEAVPETDSMRTATIAVLPTLTRYSRTSFFTGSLGSGGQGEERSGFSQLTGGGKLFHKADLVAEAGQAVSASVIEAIASEAPLTAVVLNTVDDALSKADPGGTDWTLGSIQHLAPLLVEASRGRRSVILLSDHGHVVERGSTPMTYPNVEARWRPTASGPINEQCEIALTGTRVLAENGSIIAAVSEDIRYATKQAGYHGGASAAEITIPIIVLSRQPDDLRSLGWVPAPPQAPTWWNDTWNSRPLTTPAEPKLVTKKALSTTKGQLGLDIEIAPVDALKADTSAHDLISELLESSIYQGQKKRYGARAADDATVRSVLSVLLAQSGRAHRDTLASAAGIPAMRMNGALITLRRQLNIEGYDVISTDADEVTVILNSTLLREQFLEDGVL
jgi:hypothetical protein